MRWILLAALLGLLIGTPAGAEEIIMLRVARTFPETMSALQDSIRARGYSVSRVQRVDVGLTTSGYQTAEYRVVFYGKTTEMRALPAQAPDLVPYLPLNIVVYAEGDDTLLLTTNPTTLAKFFNQAGLAQTFHRWEQDVRAIFQELATPPN